MGEAKYWCFFFSTAYARANTLLARIQNDFPGLFPKGGERQVNVGKSLRNIVGETERGLLRLYTTSVLQGDESKTGTIAQLSIYEFFEKITFALEKQNKKKNEYQE